MLCVSYSEFTLAEIEHFVNPADKRHSKFREVADFEMNLLSRELQTGEEKPARMTAGDAVTKVPFIDIIYLIMHHRLRNVCI